MLMWTMLTAAIRFSGLALLLRVQAQSAL